MPPACAAVSDASSSAGGPDASKLSSKPLRSPSPKRTVQRRSGSSTVASSPGSDEPLEPGARVERHAAARVHGDRLGAGEEHGQRAAGPLAVARQPQSREPVEPGAGIAERERHRIGEGRPGRSPGALGRRVGQGASLRGSIGSASTSTAVPSTS